MLVRKLKKSHRNVTGRFYSTLLNRLVQFDSLLERDFILLLDMHPSVRWFAEQPLKIVVRLGELANLEDCQRLTRRQLPAAFIQSQLKL
jgi:hypothetical protein